MFARRARRALAAASLLAAAACLQLHSLLAGRGDPLPRDVVAAELGGADRGVSLLQHSARLGLSAAPRVSGASALEAGQAPGDAVGAPRAATPVGTVAPAGTSGDEAFGRQLLLVAKSLSTESAVSLQLLFSILYFFLIARKYPKLPEDLRISLEVSAFQQRSVPSVVCDRRWENVFLACCCHAPRAAHTMDAVGIMDYWPGCALMTIMPCCTLWLVHTLSDLKDKLGTAQRSCLKDCACVLFCGCCVIAQDAIALDMIVGVRTRVCGVDPAP